MNQTAGLLRLLGDEARLRILHLLDRQRLNVSELVEILGLSQPTVSRHLKLLREAGLLEEDRRAGWSFYRTRPGASNGGVGGAVLREIRASGAFRDDVGRLQEILRRRDEQRSVAAPRLVAPGRSWTAWARALGLLLPKLRVAELGCGEGALTLEVASWARWVVGIDRSPEALRAARLRARRKEIANVRWREGDFERLPLWDEAVDLAILSQVLHATEHPDRVLAEARRILVSGGKLLVLELKPHKETWVLERLGHARLGFRPRELRALLKEAGFERVRVRPGDARRGNPFRVLVADARKPGKSGQGKRHEV